MENFGEELDKEIKKVFDTLVHLDNSGSHTLKVCKMGYEFEPPITDEDKQKLKEINEELDEIYEFEKQLSEYKKQLELTKELYLKLNKK